MIQISKVQHHFSFLVNSVIDFISEIVDESSFLSSLLSFYLSFPLFFYFPSWALAT